MRIGGAVRKSSPLALILLLATTALAQTKPGAINGSVSDKSHLPVPNAAIQAKNLETGTVYKATAGLLGNYQLANLPPGKYELSATAIGFQPYEKKDLVVVTGETLRVDVPAGDFISLDTLGEDRLTVGTLFLTRPRPPEGPAPRTADGKPDFSGLWYGPLPPSDTPELQPWAQAVEKERRANNLKDGPNARCLPFNVAVMNMFLNRVVQTRDFLSSIIEYDIPGYRQIYLDGREHPKDIDPSWTGHSIGKWEGDTLVIDTIGFNDKTWLGEAAPHTDKLHLVTRVRRPDLGHLEIETTVEDPGALKKPWMTKGTATLAPPKEEIMEFICNENNQDVEHLVGK
jgi:hypothetical protein